MARIHDADRKLLWSRSGDECAFLGCTQRLTLVPANEGGESTSSGPVVIGEEAHIVAEEDDGPRGDPSMSISERNAYPNRILLCPTHHTLIDKDHGIHFTVAKLLEMKAAHEALVEARRVGAGNQRETLARRRQDLLLEAASASAGRLIASWLAAGVSPELAQALAEDESVGAPGRLSRTLPQTGLVVLEGDFGSGKSVTSERIFAADISTALSNENAPIPVHLIAKYITGSLLDSARAAAAGLGDPASTGLRLVLDGLDEPGTARARELLNEARSLVFTWPNTRVIATSRPGLDLNRGELLSYPPLSDDEAAALVERLGGHRSVLWSGAEAIRRMLHLPLFLIVATLRQQAGAEVPKSQGTFLEALADAALRRVHYPTDEARRALKALARLTVASGGSTAAAELGSEDAVRSVLETRLVVRDGRSLRFALPVVERYFAAQTVLEAGLSGLDLSDLRLLDRWRDSLTLAVTVGSWQQVNALLNALAPVHPGLASWLIDSAVPTSTMVASGQLPDSLESARRLRTSLATWVDALGPLGQRLLLTDSTGKIRTVGAFVEGNRVTAALKIGENADVDATQLPYGLNPFTGEAPDGSEWAPYRWGDAPADFMAWPWQWSLDWVSSSLESILRAKSLPLSGTKPFQDERRWAIAKGIIGRIGSIDHRPISVDELRGNTERLIAYMTSSGALFYKPYSHRRLIAPKEEITNLLGAIDSGALDAPGGMLRRPHPAPDLNSSQGGHVSSVYSDEVLRSLVEQVYSDAFVIYRDLVDSWFPAFAPTLGLASILPVAFEGKIVPRADGWGGPDFLYHMTPLPLDQPSSSSVLLAARREDLNVDRESMFEDYRRLRQLIAALHPGSEGWARPRSADATLWVYGDMPSTTLAYGWLWEDLRTLHTVKNNPPSDRDL